MHKILLISLLIITSLTSCNEKSSKSAEVRSSEVISEFDKEINLTSIQLSDTVFNLGNVSAVSTTTVYVKILNKGLKPILIKDVVTSCGCTVPKFPKTPIKLLDSIEINFTPRGNLGIQNKKVRIYTNTKPEMNEITIKANVIEQ